MRAFVFPGQGSHKVGMGAELAGASAAAREVFEEVDEALGQKLSATMREGPEEVLMMTENAQPAIMANAIAILRVLEKEGGLTIAEKGDCVAGHSLGEYSALCAAGAFKLADTARLLKLRGQTMQAAVPVGIGAMCALLGADVEKAQKLADAAAQGQVCEVANDNDPTQVVLSGHREAIERAVALAKEFEIRRAVILAVSAPFHCALMAPAAEVMEQALAGMPPSALRLPIYANFSASAVSDSAEERELLVKQVCGRVRWRESVLAMHAAGVEHFVELGGKVLGPMIMRTLADVSVTSVITIDDIEALMKEL